MEEVPYEVRQELSHFMEILEGAVTELEKTFAAQREKYVPVAKVHRMDMLRAFDQIMRAIGGNEASPTGQIAMLLSK